MNNNKENNLEKEFVPYEESLALEKLGFDEWCFSFYHNGQLYNSEGYYKKDDNVFPKTEVVAPTFSQVFRFFRENYNLPSNLELLHNGWDYVIYTNIIEETNFNDGPFSTHEEAELACLKRLIKIANELE